MKDSSNAVICNCLCRLHRETPCERQPMHLHRCTPSSRSAEQNYTPPTAYATLNILYIFFCRPSISPPTIIPVYTIAYVSSQASLDRSHSYLPPPPRFCSRNRTFFRTLRIQLASILSTSTQRAPSSSPFPPFPPFVFPSLPP